MDGINLDVRVKSVEQDSTSRKVGNIEMVRDALVLKVLNRLQWRNNVSFACNVFFNDPFSASSRSRIPAQDAYTRLLKLTVGHAVVETVFWLGRKMSSLQGLAIDGFGTSFARQLAQQCCRCVGHRPSCISVAYGRDVFVSFRENCVV